MNARDALTKALEQAIQLAEIVADWNMDEVQIDNVMMPTRTLQREWREILALRDSLPQEEQETVVAWILSHKAASDVLHLTKKDGWDVQAVLTELPQEGREDTPEGTLLERIRWHQTQAALLTQEFCGDSLRPVGNEPDTTIAATPASAQEVFDNWNAYLRPVDREDFKAQLIALVSKPAAPASGETPGVVTRYDEDGNETPDGTLVFYSDYDELRLDLRKTRQLLTENTGLLNEALERLKSTERGGAAKVDIPTIIRRSTWRTPELRESAARLVANILRDDDEPHPPVPPDHFPVA